MPAKQKKLTTAQWATAILCAVAVFAIFQLPQFLGTLNARQACYWLFVPSMAAGAVCVALLYKLAKKKVDYTTAARAGLLSGVLIGIFDVVTYYLPAVPSAANPMVFIIVLALPVALDTICTMIGAFVMAWLLEKSDA